MKLLIAPAALLFLSLGIACSSDDSDDNNTSPTATTQPSATQPASGVQATATTPAGSGSNQSAEMQELTVTAGESGQNYYFELTTTELSTGTVQVTFTNAGPSRPHSFVVRDANGQTVGEVSETQPGQTRTVEFELTAAGSYQFICDLRGHADRGQRGTLTVS